MPETNCGPVFSAQGEDYENLRILEESELVKAEWSTQKNGTYSTLGTDGVPQRRASSSISSMVLHWLNEGPHESTSAWLLYLMDEARGSNDVRLTHNKSLLYLFDDIEAAFRRNVVHSIPKPSKIGMLDPIPDNESLPSLSDGSSHADQTQIEEDILDLLIQRLYRSLYFKNVHVYRTCVNDGSGKGTASSPKNTASGQSGQKRANPGGHNPTPEDDREGESGSVKKARKGRPNLEDFATAFACLLCKRDIKFGFEGECRDWKSHNIDTVLRRHLRKHVEIEHISMTDYNRVQVNEVKKAFTFASDGKPEHLWIGAFMVLFDIPETHRHKVPSPYWSMQDDVRHDPPFPTFHASMRQRLTRDPAVAVEIAQYFRENDALASQREARRDQLRRHFDEIGQKRKEQVQTQIDDEFHTAEKILDLDFARQQRILDQRYMDRWPLHDRFMDSMRNSSPLGYSRMLEQQQAPAMTSPPLASGVPSLEVSDPPQRAANLVLDDFVLLPADSPRTPSASVDPQSLGTNVEVRPSSVSPSAGALDDPGFDDSGIGMCNSALPCGKDYVCDYHKPYHINTG